MGTMKPISFNQAGQFGVKPKRHPALVEQEEIKEDLKEEDSLETELFMCPNCDADFPEKRKLQGHMLKYTRNKNKEVKSGDK